jgi:cell wall-associated NlpC family hydrolase
MSTYLPRSRWLLVLSLLPVAIVVGSFLLSQNVIKSHAQTVKAQSVIGDQIVAFAQNIQNGDLGTGRNPDVCVSTNPVKCVQYSWGAGHGPTPGLSMGSCANWQRPTRPAGAPKFSGPACTKNAGPNGTIGLDCSGFTRWVYYLAYNKDILGGGTARSQILRPGISPVPAGEQPQPGDLVYFARDNDNEDSIRHVGIYAGNGMMINAPHTYDAPTRPTASWTPAFVREDTVASHGTPFGYYRYTASQSIPRLASSYSGTVHNITYNITSNFALSSIVEDQSGNISGQTMVTPPLYGSGPFTGAVSTDNTITFTSTAADQSGVTITFTGTVNSDKSLSGNYTVNNGQIGTWSVS